jgi:hypothetical protein
MSDVNTWNVAAASNNAAAPNGFPEGMPPSGVNDAAREVMAAVARYRSDTDGVNTSSGTNTITLAASRTMTAYAQGDLYTFKAGGTNTGATTINVDSLGAKDVQFNGAACTGGEIVSDLMYTVVYDGTQFQLMNASSFPAIDITTLEVTNIKAKDGTAAATIANGSGNVFVSTDVIVGSLVGDYAELSDIGLYIEGNPLFALFRPGEFSVSTSTITKIEGVIDPAESAVLIIQSSNEGLTSDTAKNTLRFTDTDTTTAANQPIGKIEFYNSDTSNAAVGAYILSSAVGTSGGGTIRFGAAANAGAVAEIARVASTGLTVTAGAAGIGYGTGSGGAVTQATSRTTGVTLDKTNGAITLVSAAGTTTIQSFTVTNSTVAATDTIIVNQKSGTDLYRIYVTAVGAGSFRISFATLSGTTTEQPVFNFAVIKAVTA